MGEILVKMEGVRKAFPGVLALDDCRFELRAGEVHALVGENGAGKSTLMKILCGIYARDAGSVVYFGEEVDLRSPREAQRAGITIIHQELNLVPHLSVAQNIFIGKEIRRGPFLDEGAMAAESQRLLDALGVDISPRAKVSALTVAQQQMVEIARALSYDSQVIVMDEPTAAISESETEALFRTVEEMRGRGMGIIYISHRMEELGRICDRATIMRDGRTITTVEVAETDTDYIIAQMVGRDVEYTRMGGRELPDDVVMEVRGLSHRNKLRDVGFTLRRGEILGLAGLIGAGRTEVARAIVGAEPPDAGEIMLHGKPVRIRSPHDAVRHGIGYLSEDRKKYGLLLPFSVERNVVIAALGRYANRLGFVDAAKTAASARGYVESLRIKTPGIRKRVGELSGGSQQKIVIAKWLDTDNEIMIFDEPTRGIDVGAKHEIYLLLRELAEAGKSIILISSELPELLRMSDRVVVMCEGRVTGTLEAGEATQERIMQLATRSIRQTIQ